MPTSQETRHHFVLLELVCQGCEYLSELGGYFLSDTIENVDELALEVGFVLMNIG